LFDGLYIFFGFCKLLFLESSFSSFHLDTNCLGIRLSAAKKGQKLN
jgi:hypothetical protein